MTLVVLIADAGPEAGLGHLSRSSSLALALRRHGIRVEAIGLGLDAQAERYGIRWEPATDLPPAGADAVVIDSYQATDELRARLAVTAPTVAFADDDRAFPSTALVIRSGLGSSRPENQLAGPSYACLGPEFWSVTPRPPRVDVKQVLVATGGSDHRRVGPQLATRLAEALPSAAVTLVRGPYAPPPAGLYGVRVVDAPDNLFDLLVEADLIVSTAGQTMLEALAVGAPCVALVTADNQKRQATALESFGALTVADSVERAITACRRLVADPGRRNEQAEAGRRAIDGQGAARVATAVLALARRGHPV